MCTRPSAPSVRPNRGRALAGPRRIQASARAPGSEDQDFSRLAGRRESPCRTCSRARGEARPTMSCCPPRNTGESTTPALRPKASLRLLLRINARSGPAWQGSGQEYLSCSARRGAGGASGSAVGSVRRSVRFVPRQEVEMDRYDAIIIGTGQAGPSLAGRLANAGMRVAIIERGHFGGTCLNNGCTPTKTLIASAYAAHLARRAADYGVEVGPVQVDMRRVKARKDALVERSTKSLEKWLRGLPNVTVYVGEARFSEARTVTVGAETLSAERIFINVGGRPNVPDLPGVRQVPYLTNESMMGVDFVPPHLLVVGGSYVGLEFAQMYRRFGSRVTIIEMAPRLVGREDPDVSQAIEDILAAEDIAIRLDAKCLTLESAPGGVEVTLECATGAPRVSGSHVLLAVGRVPNTDDLGLREAGIDTDDRGYIKVNDTLNTSV